LYFDVRPEKLGGIARQFHGPFKFSDDYSETCLSCGYKFLQQDSVTLLSAGRWKGRRKRHIDSQSLSYDSEILNALRTISSFKIFGLQTMTIQYEFIHSLVLFMLG
jgi:hypothetical protein